MDRSDLDFLGSSAGAELVARAAALDWGGAARVASTATIRRADPEHAAAVIDLVGARARARERIRGAERMLLTEEAVQQATVWPVAALRARRLAGRPVHDLTCSVGAELAELVRCCDRVLGSDLDPVRLRMAAHNVPAADVVLSDALRPCSRDAVLLADPARRADGRRVHDPARTSPPLPALLDAARGRDLVVKCAPGLDTDRLDWDGEVELVSLDGGVREACLWSASLATGTRRRATVLRRLPATDPGPWGDPVIVDGPVAVHAEVVTDDCDDDVAAVGEADRFIVDPDGAVVRAGLVRHWARRHGLRQLDPRIAHLTGPAVPAGYGGMEVLSRHRLDRKELRRALRERDCGSLEILVRGVEVDPDRLRTSLGLRGSRALSLVVTRIGTSAVVFLCGPRVHGRPGRIAGTPADRRSAARDQP